MSDLLKRLETLSLEKRELVLQKLKQQQQLSGQENGKKTLSLTPISRRQALPLSFAQQRLWFLDQLEGENCVYNVPFFWEIRGCLNVSALEAAIAEIIQRHEVLRTSFAVVGESPIQVIHTDPQLKMQVLDWRQLTAAEQLTKAQQLATAELQQSFNLSSPPLLRVKLLQLSERSHLLLLVIHHIVCDGWSMDIFRRELLTLYTAFCAGKPSPLPALSLQYADFAHWQRQWLDKKVLQTQLDYWQHQLADVPPLLELPTDQPRPSVQSFQGRSEFLQLNQDFTQKLKHLSQESGTTLFMTLLAAFTLLLSRYSRQEDIVVGSAIANRHRREIEPLIGFFVNTLALRINLQGNPTFTELLQRVKQVTLDAYDHQDLPFEKLVDELGLERSLSHHPLFQVAFGLQSGTPEQLEIPGLTLNRFEWENTTTLFDLSLIFRETPQGLIGEWEYATDLFAAKTIQRMVRHFEVLLTGIVDHPNQPIHTLSLLTEEELQQLQSWNQTHTEYPQDKTLVDLLAAQVANNPDHVALVFESTSLTYQQLNEQANQLAHYLIENHQIQPDTLIGICVERSLEMIIGVFAILKAGGAYVPIDPNYPQARIQFMLEDAGISVLLTQSFVFDQLPLADLTKPCAVICLDNVLDQDAKTQKKTNPISRRITPDNLAYVIYTSGSTGQPKGVMIEHRAIVNLALAWAETFQVQPQSRWIQFGSFSFDLSIGEIATTLSAGACLYLAKKENLLPSQALVDLLADHQISHLALPPSALSVLPPAPLPDLQAMIVGGEACGTELVEQWGKTRSFFNCYGPTESTVIASICRCEANGKKPSIGQPLANNSIYILDAHHQILPPGIAGELCIAGVGLARGYLNRPETTAEKFIDIDLFGKTERIYKTGDLARWGDDGNLEYLGRIDEQVKLRGFRIELGEIESLLLQHPLVKEASVILSETDSHPRLIAYVIEAEKSVNLGMELQEYLKKRLPNYMLPNQIMVLEKLPLTANGKLDRRALPAPNIATAHNWEIPVTPTEEILANLWQDLLKVQAVGRCDHFFELGGHSLLATQLVARIRDSFGVELPVRKVFEQSILSDLAREINQASVSVALPPIAPQLENEPKTLSFAQSRLWFIAQLEAEGNSASYNMPCAYQFEGNLNVEALRQSLTYLLQRHTSLRSYFPALEGEPQVVVRNVEDIEVLEIADLQALDPQTQAETVQKLADNHAQAPFNLNTGPLFCAKLLQLNPQKNILLINMHHIISDGWSMGVFKREWEQAYAAYAVGSTPKLSPLPIQYSDYAAWQRSWLQGEILTNQENYWQQQLGDAPRLLELPTDYPRPAQQSYQGEHEEYCLSRELTQQLKTLSQKQGVSLFMTLLTAFSILLSRYSRQDDLCIGSAIANRTHSYTEGLIGFFVNTLVLRSRIQPEQSFSDLLQKTRQTCLDAYAHQDIPFEYLVEKLQPERSLSRNPLCQVMIALQNTEGVGTNVSLPELDIEFFEQSFPFAKFDLGLDLRESNEQLHCTWEYATDLFAADTIKRMARHLEVLLTAITQNPHQPITQLPLMTTAEIQQLQAGNQTDTDYPQDQTLVTLFEQQAAQIPDKMALVFADRHLTYDQLNQKANQLAHYLIQNHQIQPDTLIGICVERSLEMIIGVLGILKAGGAYVPIDPNYPPARIKFMLEDSGISVLLTQSFLKPQLPTALDCQVICLDQETFSSQLTENPSPQSQPDHLAYVIYTSGSTGKPKGVMIEHRAIVNLSLVWAQTFQVTDQSRLLQFGSFSFDLSVAEIVTNLVTGACLYLGDQETLLPSQSLIDFLTQHKITHSFLSPSALSVLPKVSLPDLQYLTVGGEACSAELVSQWGTEQQLYNCYGPTESTVTAALVLCQPNGKKPPIGKPISNLRIYILDAHNQPLPPGIPGELCIAGVGLARGYLHRPEITAEKFIELELFGKTERIYKTGDLARWLPDGNLEYLGRIDQQVKLRGFRIELTEIEASLVKHPQIQEAVVIVREETGLDQRLVAYIVPTATEESTNPDELVQLWAELFNNNYSHSQTPTDDPTLNIVGWNDSYTGQPIPQAAMQEWRDTTVDKILELAPQKVWEIGCGSGMLLFKIAPHCQHYLGTDFSPDALQYIAQHLEQQSLQEKVTLKACAAHQFDGIATNVYDLVIINSVIQYFPSLDYLLEVLGGAMKSVATHGSIFIGDVRNLLLLDTFHTAVEFYRASDDLSIQELRQQIQKSIRTEEELLIDPDFFIALKQRFPRISHVQIQLKPGYSHTEMSRFRYDVVLHLDRADTPLKQPEWLDWQDQQLHLETIQEILTTEQPDLLGIKGIPNARLISEMALLEHIPQLDGSIKDLKAAIAKAKSGIEPEVFHALAQDLPYTSFIQYSSTGFSNYDVVFQRHIPGQETLPRFATKANWRLKPWQNYANQPLQYRTNQVDPALLEEWRDFLGKTLPDYMIPSHFTILEKLPLTPNGKLDRKALPVTDTAFAATDIELPVTQTEQSLAHIWSKLLKYEAIARQDNFFNLGGHSLLATQLCYRIRDQFQVELPLAKVFEFPTLSELANYLDTCIWVNSTAESIQPITSDEEENRTLNYYTCSQTNIMTKNQPVVSLMQRLQNMGCRIWAEDDKLRIRTSKNALTSELKQEIQNNKADILTFLKSTKTETVTAEVIPRLSADSPKVLSFAQQRLWVLAQIQGVSATYNMPIALQLDGNLNLDALHSSLAYLLNRHASLRMYFPTVAGQPQIAIHNLDEIAVLTVQDYRKIDQHLQLPTPQALIDAYAQEPFDLNTDPLLKVQLLQLSDRQYILLINMHHIISDGWSMGVFVRELRQAYTALSQGQTPNLPALPIQYTDYAAWQRNWLQGEVLEKQIHYWKQQLQDAPPLLELPTDYLRPAQQSYRGDRYTYSLTPELTTAVKNFSQQQGVSLYMTLLATLGILLSRYSRQNDLCIGSPIANRTHSQTEPLIGFFVNTLVLRHQINPEQSFIELLQQTRQTCLDAYAHQDIPFEMLVEKLQPERSMSYNPLFQVMFALENNASPDLGLPGLDIQWLGIEYAIAKFDLTLLVMEEDNQLNCAWEYATDLFEEATIQRMAEQFAVLLQGIIDHPQHPIHTLPLITAAELLQLQNWNQTQTDYPQEQTLAELFAAQVAKTPDHIAVSFASQQLTYQQLNEKANQLAHYLIEHHQIQPDTLIGICVERSTEMIIGLLGILKAGGAYVPIDPNYPQERIEWMLKDCQTSLLLTQSSLFDQLVLSNLENPCEVICLDQENFASESIDNPSPQSTPDDLAYVIYTSGSTGKPKGVAVTQIGVNRLVLNTNYLQFYPTDRVAQAANIAFDAATFEIWGALLHGATLVGIPQDVLLSPQKCATYIRETQISILLLTTAVFNQLVSFVPQIFNSLRCLLFGGETVDPNSVAQVLHHGAPQRLVHVYGPTENTTFSSCYLVEDVPEKAMTIPIGSAIANTQIYILDKYLQPVPIGLPGELHVSGAGLARGYLNRPNLTSEKFIETELFGKTERIYKTGDLARWKADGNIEFLGRIDNQIKLRGFRIELGEIESVVLEHPSVKEAIVTLYKTEHNQSLIAYVTATTTDLATELKNHLKSRLPNYMIPAQIIVLDKLPLTPNGKIDRKALPVPNQGFEALSVAPRNNAEQTMAQLWSAVLERQEIGIHDNFFDLGGHSLLAIKLLNDIQQVFGQQLSLGCLFQNPTIAQIAQQIRQTEVKESHPDLVALQPLGDAAPLFCISGSNGHGFYFRDLANNLAPERPVYGLDAPGRDGLSAIPHSVTAHASQLLEPLRQQQPQGPYLLAGYSSGCSVAFEMAAQLEQQGEQVSLLAIFDAGLVSHPEYLTNRPDIDWIWQLLQRIEALKGVCLGLEYADLAAQSHDQARWDLAAESLYNHNVLPEHSTLALLKTNMELMKVLTRNYANYQPPAQISAPIVLFRAQEVHEIVLQELRAMTNYDLPDWGWQAHAQNPVQVISIPGNHGRMLYEPNVKIVAKELQMMMS